MTYTLTDCLYNRFARMEKQDGSRQVRIIRMAMDISGYGRDAFINSCIPIEEADFSKGDYKERFYKKAMEIAKWIEDEAIWDEGRKTVGWVEPLLIGIKEERVRLSDGDMYFYNGIAGIAVFLYGIHLASGEFGEICNGVKILCSGIRMAACLTGAGCYLRIQDSFAEKHLSAMHISFYLT